MRIALMAAAWLLAGAAAAEPALPSDAEVGAALTRIYGWRPDFELKVYRVDPSALPGFAVAYVEIRKDQFQTLYITADGKHAFLGELTPFGADPYAPMRDILKPANGPSRGGAPGGVDLVVFEDLQCPFCRDLEPMLDRLFAEVPQVRQVVQVKLIPHHAWARLAAGWADCVTREKPEAYWSFEKAVFAAQTEITPETAPARFAAIVAALGLRPGRISACAGSPETAVRIDAALALAERAGVVGTPSVFVNGRELNPGFSYDDLKAVARFELDHAGR